MLELGGRGGGGGEVKCGIYTLYFLGKIISLCTFFIFFSSSFFLKFFNCAAESMG